MSIDNLPARVAELRLMCFSVYDPGGSRAHNLTIDRLRWALDTIEELLRERDEAQVEHTDHIRKVMTHADRRIRRLRALADGYFNLMEMEDHENEDLTELMLAADSACNFQEEQNRQLTKERDAALRRVAELEQAIREEMEAAND